MKEELTESSMMTQASEVVIEEIETMIADLIGFC